MCSTRCIETSKRNYLPLHSTILSVSCALCQNASDTHPKCERLVLGIGFVLRYLASLVSGAKEPPRVRIRVASTTRNPTEAATHDSRPLRSREPLRAGAHEAALGDGTRAGRARPAAGGRRALLADQGRLLQAPSELREARATLHPGRSDLEDARAQAPLRLEL